MKKVRASLGLLLVSVGVKPGNCTLHSRMLSVGKYWIGDVVVSWKLNRVPANDPCPPTWHSLLKLVRGDASSEPGHLHRTAPAPTFHRVLLMVD